MAISTLRKQTTMNIQDPAWMRIQSLSDELVATAEAGDWTRLLVLENEWLESIKNFVIDHQAQKNQDLSVDYLENLLQINDDLYQQCKSSRTQLENDITSIRTAKQSMKLVSRSYGDV